MNDRLNIQIQHEYRGKGKSRLEQYQDLILGTRSIWFLIKFETVVTLFSRIPGALGIVLRKVFYPMILGKVGHGVVFGMDTSFRHPLKIEIGDRSIIDDGVLLDAKGGANAGINIGANCYVGRGTILGCKEGDIIIGDYANISAYCYISSNSRITIGEKTLLGPYVSLFATMHNFDKVDEAILDQAWTSKGIEIASDCWLGAKVTVLDGVTIGESAVIGAGALVMSDLPPRIVAVGTPAKVVRRRG